MAQGPNVAQHLMSCEPPEYIMFMVVMFIMKDQHVLILHGENAAVKFWTRATARMKTLH